MSHSFHHLQNVHKMNLPSGGRWERISPVDMARLNARPDVHRLPPSEYTRVLLRAKDGNLSPGAADTLINRLGGRVRVKPIPRPPE